MNLKQKTELVKTLLPILNNMAEDDRKGKIYAEIIHPITLADLMALSDHQLAALQKLAISAGAAKKTQKAGKLYDALMEKEQDPKYKIIC